MFQSIPKSCHGCKWADWFFGKTLPLHESDFGDCTWRPEKLPSTFERMEKSSILAAPDDGQLHTGCPCWGERD